MKGPDWAENTVQKERRNQEEENKTVASYYFFNDLPFKFKKKLEKLKFER